MKEGNADMKTRTNNLIMKQGRKTVGTKPGYTLMDLADQCNRPDAMKQAILDEEERRKGSLTNDDENVQPATKKQRIPVKEEEEKKEEGGEEVGDIADID